MKLLQHNHTVESQEFQTVSHQGRDHWIIPVIMMVEGVHHGSAGPLLYTAEELGRQVIAWNGTPVVIGHPSDEGASISANLPELTEQIVGRLYNTHMDGLKLKAEAWIDIDHLQSVSELAYNYLMENRVLEVSIGVLAEELDKQGEFNNEEYRAVAQNLQPDHLALLPGGVGACSWNDGCGVRVNQKSKANEKIMVNLKTLSGDNLFKQLLKEGIGTHLIPISNETGYREIMNNVQQKLDQLDNDIRMHFLEDLFVNNFIYRVHNRENGETSFYQRSYTVQQDGSIEFGGEPVQVRKDISYVVMESGKLKRNKFSNKSQVMKDENASPCKIDALIANDANQWTEKDKEWLLTLEDDQFARLTPEKVVEKPAVTTNKDEPVKKEAVKTEAPVVDGPVKINSEDIEKGVKAVFNDMKSPEDFINLLPEGMKGQMNSGLKMYNEKRVALIKGIVDNSKFEATHLEKWEDTDLQNLYDSVVPEGDYSALGEAAPIVNEEVNEEIEAMAGIVKEEVKTN